MKKSIAMKWVKALKSGKYKQTRGKLRGQRGYCCLGVLCDLYDPTQWKKVEIAALPEKPTTYSFGNVEETSITDEVKDWAGMRTTDGDSNKIGTTDSFDSNGSLMTLNDKQKWGFKKIAKFIEKNYKGL